MDTTVVAQSAIGALAALIGGLGGASIATRHQRLSEQRRLRERAAEVLGLVGPLLTELHPDPMVLGIPPVEPGQQDPMVDRFTKLDERLRVVGEQLSTLAGWWPTPKGSVLAQRLQVQIFDLRYWDMAAVQDLRRNRDIREARGHAKQAWDHAHALARQLRAEIRGEVISTQRKLLLPAHPESWTG